MIHFQHAGWLAEDITAVVVKLNDAAQTAIWGLRRYASQVRAMDNKACAYMLIKLLEVRQSDPSLMQILGLLAASDAYSGGSQIARTVQSMLDSLATLIEKNTTKLAWVAKNPWVFKELVAAGLEGNTFNWKTQKFEASMMHPVAKFANWYALNPLAAKAKYAESVILGTLFTSAFYRAGLTRDASDSLATLLAAIILDGGKKS